MPRCLEEIKLSKQTGRCYPGGFRCIYSSLLELMQSRPFVMQLPHFIWHLPFLSSEEMMKMEDESRREGKGECALPFSQHSRVESTEQAVSGSSPRGRLAGPGAAEGQENWVKCVGETGSHLNTPLLWIRSLPLGVAQLV